MIMRDASSKRSRALFMSMPKCSYSTRASPRPRPSTARPPERWSRNAIFSTTRSGSFHGTITAPVPSWIRRRLRRHARQELDVVGARGVVGEVVLGRPERVEAERLGEVGDPDLIAHHVASSEASLVVLEDQQDPDFHVRLRRLVRFAIAEPGIAHVPDRVEARVAGIAPGIAVGRQHVEAAVADRRERARGDRGGVEPDAGLAAQRALDEIALGMRGPAALVMRGAVAVGLARCACSRPRGTAPRRRSPRSSPRARGGASRRARARRACSSRRARRTASRSARAIDAVITMWPSSPCASWRGVNARTPWITPHTFTSNTHA